MSADLNAIIAAAAKQRAHEDLCERAGIGGVPGRRELLDAIDALVEELKRPRAWTHGDPRDLGVDMRIAVMDERGAVWGAWASGEHADDGSPMSLWRDEWIECLDWQSSWLWMRVPSRDEHFGGRR